MRKIESKMLAAVKAKQAFTLDNTTVVYNEKLNSSSVYLHGNHIAEYQHLGGRLIVNKGTLARWPTPTTKSRLNALGASVYTKKGVTYLEGVAV